MKVLKIISVVALLAALYFQGNNAYADCVELNKNNPSLLAQCDVLKM